MVFCSQCGSALGGGSRFCNECGAAVGNAEAPPVSDAFIPSAIALESAKSEEQRVNKHIYAQQQGSEQNTKVVAKAIPEALSEEDLRRQNIAAAKAEARLAAHEKRQAELSARQTDNEKKAAAGAKLQEMLRYTKLKQG